jgi:hypothetical protein
MNNFGILIGCSYQLGAGTQDKAQHLSEWSRTRSMHAWTHTHTRATWLWNSDGVCVCVCGALLLRCKKENKTQKSSLAPLYSLFRWLLMGWLFEMLASCWWHMICMYDCLLSSSPLSAAPLSKMTKSQTRLLEDPAPSEPATVVRSHFSHFSWNELGAGRNHVL